MTGAAFTAAFFLATFFAVAGLGAGTGFFLALGATDFFAMALGNLSFRGAESSFTHQAVHPRMRKYYRRIETIAIKQGLSVKNKSDSPQRRLFNPTQKQGRRSKIHQPGVSLEESAKFANFVRG